MFNFDLLFDANIVDYLNTLIAFLALVFASRSYERNRWVIARDFFRQIDNEDMRTARKIVYDYRDANGVIEDIGDKEKYKDYDIEKIEEMKKVEKAITYVIAFYDGNSKLVLKHLLPLGLFDDATLCTASNFYELASPYIKRRWKQEGTLIYATNYTKLMTKKSIVRKKNKYINKLYKSEGIIPN